VQNVIPSIGAFGIGCEKLLIPRWWNTPITINVARAEFQIQLLPIPVVCIATSIFDFTATQSTPYAPIPFSQLDERNT
jgi:hypothetical protein